MKNVQFSPKYKFYKLFQEWHTTFWNYPNAEIEAVVEGLKQSHHLPASLVCASSSAVHAVDALLLLLSLFLGKHCNSAAAPPVTSTSGQTSRLQHPCWLCPWTEHCKEHEPCGSLSRSVLYLLRVSCMVFLLCDIYCIISLNGDLS